MKPAIYFVFLSDTHLGLKTDGIDRAEEIMRICIGVIEFCANLKKQGHHVKLVLGGDLFDSHDPGEDLIKLFIVLMNNIKKHNIDTDVIVGNHEAVGDPDRISCLSFVHAASVGYPMIELISKIKLRRYQPTADVKPIALTYLPHISKATLQSYNQDKDESKQFSSTQEYIDAMGKQAVEKVPEGTIHIAFSHLNVRMVKPGSEANLLKKSEAFLPLAFTNTQPGYVQPIIINGHIHDRQVIGENIYIGGSPIFCGFGEEQDKSFTVVKVENNKVEVSYEPTAFTHFLQFEVEMIGESADFFDREDVKENIEKIIKRTKDHEHRPVVKVSVTISADNNSYNWKNVRDKLAKMLDAHVVPIVPKVISPRVLRNIKQKSGIPVEESVKIFLKANLKNDLQRAKRVYSKTKKYLGVQ